MRRLPPSEPVQRSPWLPWLLVSLLIGTTACLPNRNNRAAEKLAEDAKTAESFDSNLTFNDITLEQADDNGKLWWKVKAKQATYSKDQKIAVVQAPQGELFQDGKPVFKVEAERGEVLQDGKSILLKGKITAIDLKDGTVLKGNEVEWQPTKDILFVRRSVSGAHKQMQFTAQEGQFLTRARKVELSGQIVAQTKDAEAKEPTLNLKTERLTWDVGKQVVSGDRPVQLDRYKNQVLTDRATANQSRVDLQAKTVLLQQNAQVTLKTSGLQVASNALLWNLNAQTLTSQNQPITIVNPAEQVTLTANQGDMNVPQNTVTLTGNVQGAGQRNQARLNADRAVWFLNTQQFEAEGNVRYQQVNPVFSLTGPKASGRLQDQQVVVSGGRVVTEIMPLPR